MKKLPLLIIALAVSACGPALRIYSDYDRDVDIGQYSTYGWLDAEDIESKNNPLYYNELNDKRIKKAVEWELNNRCYQRVDSAAELIIHYHIVIENRTAIRTDSYGYAYSNYWMQTGVSEHPYQEGTLIIDVMERKTNLLAWRGWATTAIEENIKSREKREKMIQKVVKKIFEKYPY